jgi:hypothetical protein
VVIHPEAVDRDAMDRSFFGVVSIRTHPEDAGRDPDHVPCRRVDRGGDGHTSHH